MGVKRSPYSHWGIVKPQKGKEKSCCIGCKEKRPLGIPLEMTRVKESRWITNKMFNKKYRKLYSIPIVLNPLQNPS